MKTLGIVGGGLFGRVAAAHLTNLGWKVTVFDDARPMRASVCAGCLFKPSWLSGVSNWKVGAELLDALYGVEDLSMGTHIGSLPAHRVQTQDVLLDDNYKVLGAKVSKVELETGFVTYSKNLASRNFHVQFDAVYLATGVWQDLLPRALKPKITPRVGSTMYFDQQVDPQLKLWAPYKQSVCVPIRDEVFVRPGNTGTWFGDGTVLNEGKWKPEHTDRMHKHALELGLLPVHLVQRRSGLRPMGPAQGIFHKYNKCFVGTAGGKNGVVLAAVFADRLAQKLGASK